VPTAVPSPYYLLNFERALAWIAARYDDLLDADERAFLQAFASLALRSRALLVRMLMRKGTSFRTSRLTYDEIGASFEAAKSLIALGWVDPNPPLTLDELFALSTRPEILQMFTDADFRKDSRKAEMLEALRSTYIDARSYAEWNGESGDHVLQVTIAPLCERLRLMFFGNLHQDWSEFVLADLGVFRYETVTFESSSRAFRAREDIDVYLALHAYRTELDTVANAGDVDTLFAAIMSIEIDNPWLEMRRAKLLFSLGAYAEREQHWDVALGVYERCSWPGARHRRMRVLERSGRHEAALALACEAEQAPQSEEESQRVMRMLPRLRRRLGRPHERIAQALTIDRETLVINRPAEPFVVEYVARDHLSSPHAPVFYVENTLINSLFGLLCWEAIFAPVPGAFFHPFQRGPADLHAPDFHARRAERFQRCLAELDTDSYRETILGHFDGKTGMQSQFVSWGALTRELIDIALDCLPAAHLKLWFVRLLADIGANRSGLPDLIRFWPQEQRYQLIEIKGPGDRLQDNQIRWLEYCAQHAMPVLVLDVRWAEDTDMDLPQVAA
jgi:tetratricopeptide (TPR) repeat protein